MATTSAPIVHDLLRAPTDLQPNPSSRVQTAQNVSNRFAIAEKTYQQQFADMYFLRLSKLKPAVKAMAEEAWGDVEVDGERAQRVDRVLDVRQGELCWIMGTVYMDMPLKPNILEDISADHFLVPPPPREKYTDSGLDQTMLEDESGRLKLTGAVIDSEHLVTGVIIAVLGTENSDGAFSVIDVRIPDLPTQSSLSKPASDDGRRRKVAIAGGLGICGAIHENLELHLLAEYLTGEAGGEEDHGDAATISRLVLAGNSLGVADHPLDGVNTEDSKKARTKKYGYDASAYNASPTRHFDAFLSSILPSLAVTLVPGATDPANIAIPQQPLHSALFATAKVYDNSTLSRVTNPWIGDIDGVSFLVTGGQNLDDVYKYVDGDDRLEMAERMLRWRIIAPTAPDTLWSYPFQLGDPFVLEDGNCPHVYVVGNQPRFETRLLNQERGGQKIRIILLPRFDLAGEVVLLDLDTLDVEVVNFKATAEELL